MVLSYKNRNPAKGKLGGSPRGPAAVKEESLQGMPLSGAYALNCFNAHQDVSDDGKAARMMTLEPEDLPVSMQHKSLRAIGRCFYA